MKSKTIKEVLKKYTPIWMSIPDVIGTGIGLCDGKPCIKVYVKNLSKEIENTIPQSIDDYQVKIEVTGPIKAQ
jgi:hypothetical protein